MQESELQVRELVEKMLIACEETKQFPFNSRYFFKVGEWELAFKGVYRFMSGNDAFRQSFEPEFTELCEHLKDEWRLEGLEKHAWR